MSATPTTDEETRAAFVVVMMVVMVMVTLVAMVAVAMADDRMVARVTPRSRRRTPRRGRSTSRRFPRISSTITPRTSRGNAPRRRRRARRDEKTRAVPFPFLRGRWVRLPRTDARGAARARAGSPRFAASLRRRRSPRRDLPRRRVRRRGASPGAVRTPRDSGRRLDDVGEHDVVRADAAVSGARRGGRGEADRRSGGRPLAGTQVRRRIAGIAARRRHKPVNSPRRESTTRVVDSVFIVCCYHVCIHRYNMSS